jgi:hypothetical protein
VPSMLPGAQHVVSYHIVSKGTCWVTLADGPSSIWTRVTSWSFRMATRTSCRARPVCAWRSPRMRF